MGLDNSFKSLYFKMLKNILKKLKIKSSLKEITQLIAILCKKSFKRTNIILKY